MTGALVAVAGGLLLDIPALLLGVLDLSTHLLRHVLAEFLGNVGAHLSRHLDVVADLAGNLLTLNTLTVRAHRLGLLPLNAPRNVLAFGGRNFITELLGDFGALF